MNRISIKAVAISLCAVLTLSTAGIAYAMNSDKKAETPQETETTAQTEETKKADKELKKANREYEKFLSELSAEQRNFLENYMDIVDHAHFQEQQRSYYQGIVDAVQILAGLGIVKESVKVKELLNTIMK